MADVDSTDWLEVRCAFYFGIFAKAAKTASGYAQKGKPQWDYLEEPAKKNWRNFVPTIQYNNYRRYEDYMGSDAYNQYCCASDQISAITGQKFECWGRLPLATKCVWDRFARIVVDLIASGRAI